MAPPRRRRSTLRGTNLYIDPRNGNYIWRRVHEVTGDRMLRSTRSTNLTVAIQRAAKFEDDYQASVAGINRYDGWKLDILPLIPQWTADVRATENTRTKYENQVTRAVARLGLARLSDLNDIERLERSIANLERDGSKRKTLVRTVQKPLKQFARWLASKRLIDRDPLASWRLLDLAGVAKRPRRAFHPEEVARALEAAGYLDTIHGRKFAQRPLYLALLISAARVGSVVALDIAGLDTGRKRLLLGPDVRNKHRGEAALDAATLEELTAHVGERESGPLFPSPRGSRNLTTAVLDDWRAAFGLGLVWELAPNLDRETAGLVNHFLASGSVSQSGREPTDAETRKAREDRARRVTEPARAIENAWRARMVGVDVHALKTTHRTWGEVAGVHPLVLDKQCGHSTPAGAAALDAAKALLANPIGRKHYVDLGVELVDARRAAEAVRRLLDDAERANSARPSRAADAGSST